MQKIIKISRFAAYYSSWVQSTAYFWMPHWLLWIPSNKVFSENAEIGSKREIFH